MTTGMNRAGRRCGGNKWGGRLFVPKKCDSLVRQFFEILNQERTQITEVRVRAGLGRTTIRNWKAGRVPNLMNFRAALNVIGYDLAIVRRRQ